MTYTEMLQWISSLTEKQLTEFLVQAFKTRKDSDELAEIHFFVGHAFRYKQDAAMEPWSLQIACIHDPEEYPDGWMDDAPLCQYGHCSNCKVETVSYAKQSLCSLCGKPVYGT
jgi:hypothetical protein